MRIRGTETSPMSTTKKNEEFELVICEWQGKIHCIYLNDYRIAGGKPWGGGKTLKTFKVKRKDLDEALSL